MAGDNEEPKRFLGFPVADRSRQGDGAVEQLRILGVPKRWFVPTDPGRPDLRWLAHPLRWMRWRIVVHHHGPFAPRFEDYREQRR